MSKYHPVDLAMSHPSVAVTTTEPHRSSMTSTGPSPVCLQIIILSTGVVTCTAGITLIILGTCALNNWTNTENLTAVWGMMAGGALLLMTGFTLFLIVCIWMGRYNGGVPHHHHMHKSVEFISPNQLLVNGQVVTLCTPNNDPDASHLTVPTATTTQTEVPADLPATTTTTTSSRPHSPSGGAAATNGNNGNHHGHGGGHCGHGHYRHGHHHQQRCSPASTPMQCEPLSPSSPFVPNAPAISTIPERDVTRTALEPRYYNADQKRWDFWSTRGASEYTLMRLRALEAGNMLLDDDDDPYCH